MGETVFCRNCGVLNALARGCCRECRAELAPDEPVSPPLKPDLAPAYLEPRPCPVCGAAMGIGEAFLGHRTGWQSLFVNRGWMELFFRRKGKRPCEPLLRPGQRIKADRCWTCNVVLLTLPPHQR